MLSYFPATLSSLLFPLTPWSILVLLFHLFSVCPTSAPPAEITRYRLFCRIDCANPSLFFVVVMPFPSTVRLFVLTIYPPLLNGLDKQSFWVISYVLFDWLAIIVSGHIYVNQNIHMNQYSVSFHPSSKESIKIKNRSAYLVYSTSLLPFQQSIRQRYHLIKIYHWSVP